MVGAEGVWVWGMEKKKKERERERESVCRGQVLRVPACVVADAERVARVAAV